MKKLFLMLGMGTILLVSSARAENGDTVNEKVRRSFHQEFVTASDISWSRNGDLEVARFRMNDRILTAYFTQDGELKGASRNLLSTELPISLQVALKRDYADYWITELFELAGNGESAYYLTLQNADQVLTLQSTDGSDWSVYRRIRK